MKIHFSNTCATTPRICRSVGARSYKRIARADRIAIARNRLYVLSTHDFSVQCAGQNHALTQPCFHMFYKTEAQDSMKGNHKNVYWIDGYHGKSSLSVGFAQLHSDKTAASLKRTVLVAYSVHAVLPRCSVTNRIWVIESELSSIRFLQTQFGASVKDEAESRFRIHSAR